MRQLRLAIAMFVVSVAVLWGSQAYAGGYTSLGSAWYVNTYSHQMDFDAPQSDVKNNNVDFLSDTTWYDNLFVCLNNGQKSTWNPGGGQTDTSFYLRPGQLAADLTSSNCSKTGSVNDCSQTVTYYTKLSEVQFLYTSPSTIPLACQTTFPTDPYGCYLYLLGLPRTFQCQNSNGTLIQVITKGLCARQTAFKDFVPQAAQAYRFTYPSFDQPETTPPAQPTTFSSTMDNTCNACVDWNGTGTNPCLPPPQ